jgi:hypothetical protein
MRRTEIIHLRVADANCGALDHELSLLLPEVGHKMGFREMNARSGAISDCDWSIHLRWTSERTKLQGSATCFSMTHVLVPSV